MKLRENSGRFRQWGETLLQKAKRGVAALPGVLTSHRFATSLLLVVIAAEFVALGVGVVRRLETAAKDMERAAMMEMAAFEAQAFAHEQEAATATASIGTAPPTLPTAELVADQGAPPPLRPRDVDTILAQDTDDWIASWDAGPEDAQTGTAPASSETPVTAEGDDTDDEVDVLIRQGCAALTAGDMRKCLVCLEQARALNPHHPAVLYYMGMAYDKLLNPTKARFYYTQVFNMRAAAGMYFERAARRLSYGVDNPADMRGKLAFGPYRVNHTYEEGVGERVDILLPVLLAPGQELEPDGIYIKIVFFDLVNNRRIEFAHARPELRWERDELTWRDGEENIIVTYTAPELTIEEQRIYGGLEYYGFVAKLYYNGEPLDCISTPSALILHEQRLNLRGGGRTNDDPSRSLLPEDEGLEEAIPYSDFSEELDDTGS